MEYLLFLFQKSKDTFFFHAMIFPKMFSFNDVMEFKNLKIHMLKKSRQYEPSTHTLMQYSAMYPPSTCNYAVAMS